MWFKEQGVVITPQKEKAFVNRFVAAVAANFNTNIKKCLLLPPDITRRHSGAGTITALLYQKIMADNPNAIVHVMPTLGQHRPHSVRENKMMFGEIIPQKNILTHHWKKDVRVIGKIDKKDILQHAKTFENDNFDLIQTIPIDLNTRLFDSSYDAIISVGQVVPHEIFGMANHNKNIFIGLGGKQILCGSQMLASLLGIENNLGQITTPLRGLFNLAEKKYLHHLPIAHLLIVRTPDNTNASKALNTTGLYAGSDYHTYLNAAFYARNHCLRLFDKPIKKIVTYLTEEFRSTWVSNKAIYRTRLALQEGGELLVIAPFVDRFGERRMVQNAIKRYGYSNTSTIVAAYRKYKNLQKLANAASHLINGSTENRFTVHYATNHLSKKALQRVGYQHYPLAKALQQYNVANLTEGFHHLEDEEIYFIPSPSLGLWASKDAYQKTTQANQQYIAQMKNDADNSISSMWQKIYDNNQNYC